jgi:hypothetical protein
VHIDTPAADVDQLTRVYVGQHSLVLRRGGRRLGLDSDDGTEGKQQGRSQSGPGDAMREGCHEKPWNNVSAHVHWRLGLYVRDGISNDSTRLEEVLCSHLEDIR